MRTPARLGRHGHQQVLLVAAGQRHEAVGAEDILRLNEVVVRAIALDDHGPRQVLGQEQALVVILLYDADMGIGAGQLPRQVHADAAAAQQGHVLHPMERAAHDLQHLLELTLGAHQIQPVVGPGHKGAVGNDALVAPLGGADQHVRLALAVEAAEAVAHQRVLRQGLQADHIDAAAGKGLHGDGGGKAEDAGYLLGRSQIGVDDHVQSDLPLQDVRILPVLGVADAGHGMTCAQALGDEAADHVGVIHAGDGDDQIRRADAGVHQDADGRAAAVDAHNIHRTVGAGQVGDLVVHHDDVVLLLGQLAGDGVAHLAAAHNDDLHASSSPPDEGAACFFRWIRDADSSAPSIRTCPDIYSHSSTTTMVAMEPYSCAYRAIFST